MGCIWREKPSLKTVVLTSDFADCSTGEQEEKLANIAAGTLLAQLPLDKIARTKPVM
jgi:hypothetical protein